MAFRAIACGEHSELVTVMLSNMQWDDIIVTPTELPPIESFDPTKRTLVVFKNCTEENIKKVPEFLFRGRRHNVSILVIESSLLNIPKIVRRNTDVIYLTSDPRAVGWREIKHLMSKAPPIVDCFVAFARSCWFKIDLRDGKSGAVDPALVRVYRLYSQIDDNDVRRMQICVAEQLVIEDFDIRAVRGRFELNVWPARFALFEAVRPTPSVLGEMVRVPQENDPPTRLEMETPSYFTFD